MAVVYLNKGMSIDKALKILAQKCDREKILSTYRKKRFYVKPSDARREARMAAERKMKKKLADDARRERKAQDKRNR